MPINGWTDIAADIFYILVFTSYVGYITCKQKLSLCHDPENLATV